MSFLKDFVSQHGSTLDFLLGGPEGGLVAAVIASLILYFYIQRFGPNIAVAFRDVLVSQEVVQSSGCLGVEQTGFSSRS